MKIHEFQGKQLLKKYQIPIQDGLIIENINDAESIISKVQKQFNTQAVIVKAQIHAGGRGKGGGVKYSPNFVSALQNTKNHFYLYVECVVLVGYFPLFYRTLKIPSLSLFSFY